MSLTGSDLETKLLAVVLQGEDNYWLAEPCISKPLDANWTRVDCFWLYRVESGITQFADVKDFDPTDSVFELDTQAVSKVLRAATLSFDVVAKKYQQGRRTYYFITQKEVNRLDLRYDALLKKESETPALDQQQRHDKAETDTKVKAGHTSGDDNRQTKTHALKDCDTAINQKKSEKKITASTVSVKDNRSHQRKNPYQGTSIYVAPSASTSTGEHSSTEAFGWDKYYIVHRGSVDYLVPKPSGNTYGFRLDKVSHDGFPVFLLFGSTLNNSCEVDSRANAVPAMEFAILKGGGGETKRVGNLVLVLTRPRGKRKREKFEEDSSDSETCLSREISEPPSSSASLSNVNSSDVKEPRAMVPQPRRGRGRPRKATLPVPRSESKIPASDKVAPPSSLEHHKKNETSCKSNIYLQEPLENHGVNVWTDVTCAIASTSELATEFTFLYNPSQPLRTSVFPDGTSVTYPCAIAEALSKDSEMKKHLSVNSQTANASGSGLPLDDDMRSLLEHIQLAKQQFGT